MGAASAISKTRNGHSVAQLNFAPHDHHCSSQCNIIIGITPIFVYHPVTKRECERDSRLPRSQTRKNLCCDSRGFDSAELRTPVKHEEALARTRSQHPCANPFADASASISPSIHSSSSVDIGLEQWPPFAARPSPLSACMYLPTSTSDRRPDSRVLVLLATVCVLNGGLPAQESYVCMTSPPCTPRFFMCCWRVAVFNQRRRRGTRRPRGGGGQCPGYTRASHAPAHFLTSHESLS